jgi:hypothetical protein
MLNLITFSVYCMSPCPDPDQNAPTFLDPDQILGLFDLSQQNYLYFQVAKSVSYNTVSSVSRKSGSESSVLMTKN